MFEWNEEQGRLEALHHPFTAPNPDDLAVSAPRGAGRGWLRLAAGCWPVTSYHVVYGFRKVLLRRAACQMPDERQPLN